MDLEIKVQKVNNINRVEAIPFILINSAIKPNPNNETNISKESTPVPKNNLPYNGQRTRSQVNKTEDKSGLHRPENLRKLHFADNKTYLGYQK